MKSATKYRFLMLFLVLVSISAASGMAQSTTTVAVVDFNNTSGERLENVEEISTEILSTLLVQTHKFDVVERSKLIAVLNEQALSMTGLIDSTKSAIEVGKLLGADLIITGSILSYGDKVIRFQGYGVTTEKIITNMSANIKILNISTGRIEFGSILTAQNESLSSAHISVSNQTVLNTLLTNILNSAVLQLTRQLNAKQTAKPEQYMVRFDSVPSGADVEIDNVFYGNTPLEIRVSTGLHQVTISLAGYQPWSKKVAAAKDLQVKAILEKKPQKVEGELNININPE